MAKKVSLGNNKSGFNVKKSTEPIQNEVSFDFSYTDWLKSVKVGEFTNKLKDPSEFAHFIYTVMNKMIPYITENWHWIKSSVYPGSSHNCHPVDERKLPLVQEIIAHTHNRELEPLIMEAEKSSLWQLGHQGAVRIIVYYMESSQTFYPLFMDYHHLIHPVKGDRKSQVKHNDYKSKKWCPKENYG